MALKIKLSDLCNVFFGNQCQKLENAARKLLYNISIDKSEGIQLDNIGTIVNQGRLGYNDTYYKILLKVKIGINVSEGEIERILTLWKLLIGSDNVTLTENYPGKIKLSTDTDPGADILIFMKNVAKNALAGGVGIDTIIVIDTDRFGFGPTFGPFNSLWPDSY